MPSRDEVKMTLPEGTGTTPIDRIEYRLTMLARLLEAFARQKRDPLERSHYLMLRHLGDKPLRIGALSDLLALDATTVTRQVTAMEERELVSRKIDTNDRRSALVERTEKGAALVAEMQTNRLERVSGLTRNWSTEELEYFAAALDNLDAELFRILKEA